MKALKSWIKKTPAIHLWVFYKKHFRKPAPQSDEGEIIDRLRHRYRAPKTFVEFGFGAWEFNCAGLVADHQGLLVDGDQLNVWYAKRTLPRDVKCEHRWLERDNLGFIKEYASARPLGILSVDVDGNDYWFLAELISTRPSIIVCEYNSSFGTRPITVPYDKNFLRFEKHSSGLYFGASLTALKHLCGTHGYTLLELSQNGVNAFFVRNDLLDPGTTALDLESGFRAKQFPSGISQEQQWEVVKDMAFVDVTLPKA